MITTKKGVHNGQQQLRIAPVRGVWRYNRFASHQRNPPGMWCVPPNRRYSQNVSDRRRGRLGWESASFFMRISISIAGDTGKNSLRSGKSRERGQPFLHRGFEVDCFEGILDKSGRVCCWCSGLLRWVKTKKAGCFPSTGQARFDCAWRLLRCGGSV